MTNSEKLYRKDTDEYGVIKQQVKKDLEQNPEKREQNRRHLEALAKEALATIETRETHIDKAYEETAAYFDQTISDLLQRDTHETGYYSEQTVRTLEKGWRKYQAEKLSLTLPEKPSRIEYLKTVLSALEAESDDETKTENDNPEQVTLREKGKDLLVEHEFNRRMSRSARGFVAYQVKQTYEYLASKGYLPVEQGELPEELNDASTREKIIYLEARRDQHKFSPASSLMISLQNTLEDKIGRYSTSNKFVREAVKSYFSNLSREIEEAHQNLRNEASEAFNETYKVQHHENMVLSVINTEDLSDEQKQNAIEHAKLFSEFTQGYAELETIAALIYKHEIPPNQTRAQHAVEVSRQVEDILASVSLDQLSESGYYKTIFQEIVNDSRTSRTAKKIALTRLTILSYAASGYNLSTDTEDFLRQTTEWGLSPTDLQEYGIPILTTVTWGLERFKTVHISETIRAIHSADKETTVGHLNRNIDVRDRLIIDRVRYQLSGIYDESTINQIIQNYKPQENSLIRYGPNEAVKRGMGYADLPNFKFEERAKELDERFFKDTNMKATYEQFIVENENNFTYIEQVQKELEMSVERVSRLRLYKVNGIYEGVEEIETQRESLLDDDIVSELRKKFQMTEELTDDELNKLKAEINKTIESLKGSGLTAPITRRRNKAQIQSQEAVLDKIHNLENSRRRITEIVERLPSRTKEKFKDTGVESVQDIVQDIKKMKYDGGVRIALNVDVIPQSERYAIEQQNSGITLDESSTEGSRYLVIDPSIELEKLSDFWRRTELVMESQRNWDKQATVIASNIETTERLIQRFQ